ncbi:MAG: hypothetical protein MZU91_10370 [Desulfosudis oleivorans]|nr:hypothetical protein [Desulfosudis oleivorans]
MWYMHVERRAFRASGVKSCTCSTLSATALCEWQRESPTMSAMSAARMAGHHVRHNILALSPESACSPLTEEIQETVHKQISRRGLPHQRR